MKAHLLGLAMAGLAGLASADPAYRLSILKPLEGNDACEIKAINDSGRVVGYSYNQHDAPMKPMATLWQDGQAISLGTLGGDWSIATAINRHGVIVGYSPPINSYEWHAFSYRPGKRHLHDLTPYRMTTAVAINDKGVVTGGLWDYDGNYNDVMVVYQGVMTPLRMGRNTWVTAIGNDGKFVLGNASDGPGDEFIYKKGMRTELWSGWAWGINSSGAVVGTCRPEFGNRACFYSSGTVHVLELAPGVNTCLGYAINDKNEVVGECEGRAIMWHNDKLFDLLNLVVDGVGTGWGALTATGVNGSGQIAGTGWRGGEKDGFLLTPIRTGHASQPSGSRRTP